MFTCPFCGAQLPAGATFCSVCGNAIAQTQAPPPAYPTTPPVVDASDHTADFAAEDIKDNKLIAAISYLSLLGIIAAALINRESAFVQFHIKQGLKLFIAETILTLATLLVITAPVTVVCLTIISVLKIIGLVWALQEKAKDLPIIDKIKFLN